MGRHTRATTNSALTLLSGFLLVSTVACSDAEPTSPPPIQSGTTIELDDGTLAGADDDGVRSFLGVPFAEPPLGQLRFASPRPARSWTGTRDATEAGPRCVQRNLISGKLESDTDEDCLSLNVWTPSATPEAPLPVMVWFHGGGFETGSGHERGGYAGDHLVKHGEVVLVTVNYRLGPFGFLAHEALSAEQPDRYTSGNAGLEDQRLALEWVRDNILAFGGDAENVTIFGESAGGMSVCGHLVSPESRGLFQHAIMQSGPCEAIDDTLAEAEQQGAALAEAIGCDSDPLTCLREASVDSIVYGLPPLDSLLFGEGVGWWPNVDGVVIPGKPLALIEEGDVAPVEVMLGTNRDETSLFVWLSRLDEIDAAGYEAIVKSGTIRAIEGDLVLEHYPVDHFDSPSAALTKLTNEGLFQCSTRRDARALAKHVPVYRYHYVYELPFFRPLGAFHASELAVLFGHDAFGFGEAPPEAAQLATVMRDGWTSFARSGEPTSTAPWSRFEPDTGAFTELSDAGAIQKNRHLSDACDIWDDIIAASP